MSAAIEVSAASGGGVPKSSYSLAGLMARVPPSPPQNGQVGGAEPRLGFLFPILVQSETVLKICFTICFFENQNKNRPAAPKPTEKKVKSKLG